MNSPKLWWIVENKDQSRKYVFETYENIAAMFDRLDIYDYSVVHPKNSKHPEEYRKENNLHIDYIEAQHNRQLQKMKELGAPEVLFKHPERLGQFGIYNCQFDDCEGED